MMKCPQCAHEQSSTVECERCGIIFSKWKPPDAAPPRDDLPSPLEALFGDLNVLRLAESPRGLLSVVTGWEVAKEFDVVDSVGRQRGSAAQQGRGIIPALGQNFVPSWVRLRFGVFSYPSQQLALTLYRAGLWVFSEMIVEGASGERLGSVQRRFSIFRRRYDLRDRSGQTFATVAGSLMTRWSFPIFDRSGQQRGEIAKKWAGMGQELAEAQRFKIDFMNHHWTLAQRAVILAAALTIDFDAFENRTGRTGIVALGD
jgi:hypothetical protein